MIQGSRRQSFLNLSCYCNRFTRLLIFHHPLTERQCGILKLWRHTNCSISLLLKNLHDGKNMMKQRKDTWGWHLTYGNSLCFGKLAHLGFSTDWVGIYISIYLFFGKLTNEVPCRKSPLNRLWNIQICDTNLFVLHDSFKKSFSSSFDNHHLCYEFVMWAEVITNEIVLEYCLQN